MPGHGMWGVGRSSSCHVNTAPGSCMHVWTLMRWGDQRWAACTPRGSASYTQLLTAHGLHIGSRTHRRTPGLHLVMQRHEHLELALQLALHGAQTRLGGSYALLQSHRAAQGTHEAARPAAQAWCAWLVAPAAPLDPSLPPKATTLPRLGCWHSPPCMLLAEPVAEACRTPPT